MRRGQFGFTLIELLVSLFIMTVAAGGAGLAFYQIARNTGRNTDYLSTVRQVENAGYWISRDAQMALTILTTANLTGNDFVSFNWTEWDQDGNPLYYSANYTFINLVNGLGSLQRTYGGGGNSVEVTVVAQNLFYSPGEATSSNTSYSAPDLTLRLTSIYKDFTETRQFTVKHRPGL